MLKFKNITLKNFLSTGAVTQSIQFDNKNLILILGENLDQGGNGARNGVGKSTIIQALSYVLFDAAITNIKKDNMINMVNGKNMLVSVDFEMGANKYRIERGRKPNLLKLYVNGTDLDEAQGENRNTQKEIEKIISMSHDMFKNIVALSTYNVPFLFMKANDQRAIIEELLGITQLSSKADVLRKNIGKTRQGIKEEDVRLRTLIETNETIEKTINQLIRKSEKFESDKIININDINIAIDQLQQININDEIENYKKNEEYKVAISLQKDLKKDIRIKEDKVLKLATQIEKRQRDIDSLAENKCPTCKQPMSDHSKLMNDIQKEINELFNELQPTEEKLTEYNDELNKLTIPIQPVLFYENIDEAYQHKQNLDALQYQLNEEENRENPFNDQIESLKNDAIADIDYSSLNELKKMLAHQEFLYKLLTNKDSFIRKKIIDQNLAYLNSRISYYLNKMGLPHSVDFKNDLTVEIVLLGKSFDFGQLSRGQQNRLALSFNFAFRDVWESTGHTMNLLFVDEMIDSGLDSIGVESTLEILKKLCRERNKDVFLISHREELLTRVDDVLNVILENGFTSYQID